MNLAIISGKRLKKSVKKTAQNKSDKQLTSLQKNNQSSRQIEKYSRIEALHLLRNSVKETALDSLVNMSLIMPKILKFIIFNLSTKNIKLYRKVFWTGSLFYWRQFVLHTGFLFAHHCNFEISTFYSYILFNFINAIIIMIKQL